MKYQFSKRRSTESTEIIVSKNRSKLLDNPNPILRA
jgi:hypothetical protein